MIVPGTLNKPTHDKWRDRCAILAAEIHHAPDEVFAWFSTLWPLRIGWPRSLAKWQALRDVRESLDRRGMESD